MKEINPAIGKTHSAPMPELTMAPIAMARSAKKPRKHTIKTMRVSKATFTFTE
jgi:hypothetical protein